MTIESIILSLFLMLYLGIEYLVHKYIKELLEIQATQLDILNKRIKILEEQLKE